jgi:hypothetical protein
MKFTIVSEIETIKKWATDKRMKAQVGSLASRIDVNQEEILDSCLERWRQIQENCSPQRCFRKSLQKRPRWRQF